MGSGFTSPSVHSVPQRVLDRVWDHVDIRGPGQCWPWQLSTASHGYGQMGWWMGNKPPRNAGVTAHRIVWHSLHGPIPDGMTVDHLCKNRPCCNPFHLRLLTNVENARDNGQGRKTHCPRGHPYNDENTYVSPQGHRRCRTCIRIARRAAA